MVDLNGMEVDNVAMVYAIPMEGVDYWSVFAWAVWITRKIEDDLDPGLSGNRLMRVTAAQAGDPDLDTGFADIDTVVQDDYNLAFAIAHEVGHWFHNNWVGQQVGGYYEYVARDADCKWGEPGAYAHGLRSAEYGRAAIVEGFAHFIAAWVFDDPNLPDALFKYYKSLADVPGYEDLEADGGRVSLLGGTCPYPGHASCPLGGPSAWVENQCDTEGTPPVARDWEMPFQVGSEIDWMRFFWQFVSDEIVDSEMSDPELTDLFDIHALAWAEDDDGAHPNYNEYDVVVDTHTHEYYARFGEVTDANGVDNGGY
jgi:hypothetical protein